MEITQEIKTTVLEIISHGLVSGMGRPVPGELCVEAAVCLALGEPHSDRPSCVAAPDRRFAIGLNDAAWPSSEARAEALAPLAVAQLGTAGTDRSKWARAIALGTVTRVLPIALDAVGLGDHAERCRAATTLEEAHAAARAARTAAYADAAAVVVDAASAAALAASAAFQPAAAAAARTAALAANAADAADDVVADDVVLREAAAVAMDAYRAEGMA